MARFGVEQAFRPTSGDTGAASYYGTLANRLSNFNANEMRRREVKVRTKAQENAAKADPKHPELENSNTVYGREFNANAIRAHQASVKSAYSLTLERYSLEHPDNPAEYSKLVNQYRSEVMEEVLPEARQMAEVGFDNLSGSYLNRIKANDKKISTGIQNKEQIDGFNSSQNDIFKLVRNNDDLSAMQELTALKELIKDSPLTELEQKDFVSSTERGMVEQAYLNDWEDMPHQEAFRELQEASSEVPATHSVEEWDKFMSGARTMVLRNKAIKDGQKATATAQDRTTVKNYLKAMSTGFQVTDEERKAAYIAAAATETTKNVMDAEELASFATLSAQEQAETMDATTGMENASLHSGMKSTRAAIHKAATDDAISLAVSQGIIPSAPIEYTQEGIAARKITRDNLSEHYGVNASLLTDPEVTALTDGLEEMTPQDKAGLAFVLAGAPEVWGQIASKNEETFAMLGATQDANVMMQAFKGQQSMFLKTAFVPKAADYLSVFQDMTGDVYPTREAAAMLEATVAHYVGGNPELEDLDPGKFEQSIQAVSGGIAKINGHKTEMPRGIPEEVFDDYINGFSPEAVSALGGVLHHTPEEAAYKIKRNRVRATYGVNKYLSVNEYGDVLLKPDGTPFIFSYDPSLPMDMPDLGPRQARDFVI